MKHPCRHRDASQEPTFDQELEQAIEKIAARPGGDELLARIAANLSRRERDLLWGYLAETDAQELGSGLGIEKQSVHNSLAIIAHKLGFDSRTEFLRRVFTAFFGKFKKS